MQPNKHYLKRQAEFSDDFTTTSGYLASGYVNNRQGNRKLMQI